MKEKRGIHVGIIPDGSRRWAKQNRIKEYDGRQSGETMDELVRYVFNEYPEVSELSVWAMSTDNLQRSEDDKELVYRLLENKINDLLSYSGVSGKGIRINVVGSGWSKLPSEIRDVGHVIIEKTKNNEGPILNLCIGYGGKQEILDAVMASSKWLRKNPTIAKLHEEVFEKFLMVPKSLDLVIRTGGEKRLSGFMLYQMEYAELFFTDTLWPDFTTKEFDDILQEFNRRDRRFGK